MPSNGHPSPPAYGALLDILCIILAFRQMKEACCRIRLKKRYIDNRIEADQADAGCFLTTLKCCFGVLRLPLGQPGDFPRIFGLRAGEPNCAKISGSAC